MRVFILSYRNCYGAVGGSGGVNYKLYLANAKRGYPVEMYHVFKDIVIEPGSNYDERIRSDVSLHKKENNLKSLAKKWLGGVGLLLVINNKKRFKSATKWLKEISIKYSFSNEDIYIMHDIESAVAFFDLFNFSKTMYVYHQQGSLYSEWSSFTGKNSKIYENYLDACFSEVVKSVKVMGFPSNGARKCLMETSSAAKNILDKREYKVLYNGFDLPQVDCSNYDDIIEVLEWINNFNGLKFITVSNLNHAKAVERIPKLLSSIKDNDFRWIVIGNGIKAEELSKEIQNYGIENNVFWIKNAVSHESIIKLFQYTEFYILLHRRSIFDFATIEAMSCGNIPILTKIGGNIEVVEGDSGLLIEDLDDKTILSEYINKIDICSIQQKNKQIQKERFSEETFLNSYIDVINNI